MRRIFKRNLAARSRKIFGSLLILSFVASTVLPFATNGHNAPATVVDLPLPPIVEEQSCLYGGVEIGSSGVKAVAIRVNEIDDGYSATEIFNRKSANTNPMDGVAQSNLMRTDRIDETAKVVSMYCGEMMAIGIPRDQIYVVGSSGLRADNLSDLSDKVREKTGKHMAFLTVDDEVNYSISGSVPKFTRVYVRSRKNRKIRRIKRIDNRGRSIFVDVGSGNTKGGYQERISNSGPPEYRVVSFGIPFGTKTLADRITTQMPEKSRNKDFSHAASSLYTETFKEPLRTAVSTTPGLVNRPKIYLAGGIVWAMATLLHPDDRSAYVKLTAADIDRFYDEAVSDSQKLLNPDLSGLDEKTRQLVESDVNHVKTTFSPKQLIAGAQILKWLSNDLMFDNSRREIRFVRAAYVAWILRYVNLKSIESENCR